MNQTWKNSKNLISSKILVPLAQIYAPQKNFYGFYLNLMLDINASYHCMQFQGKLVNQTCRKMTENIVLGPILARFGPKNFL